MRRASAAAGALLSLASCSVLLLPETRLVVTDESGALRLSADALTLRYRHSVERTIVEEDLVPRQGGVGVSETRFASFGAGLPSQPEWGGVSRSVPGGTVVGEMRGALAEIRLRVGDVSEQALVLDGRVARLDELVSPGDVLAVRARTLPRAAWALAR